MRFAYYGRVSECLLVSTSYSTGCKVADGFGSVQTVQFPIGVLLRYPFRPTGLDVIARDGTRIAFVSLSTGLTPTLCSCRILSLMKAEGLTEQMFYAIGWYSQTQAERLSAGLFLSA